MLLLGDKMRSTEQVIELIKKAQNGDEESKSILVQENSPLIKSVIKNFKNRGIEYEDLYQLGCMGFLKAIQNFDQSFNVKFSTYSVPMIAGEIKRFLRDNGIIKVSRSTKSLNMSINRFIDSYTNEHMHSPSMEEIAKHFELSEQEIVFAMESGKSPLSLNMVVGDDEGKDLILMDRIESEQSVEKGMDKMMLYNIIKDLPPRDKKIIILRYFRDKTQSEIAVELGVSQVQVSRLESKILQTIKEKLVQ